MERNNMYHWNKTPQQHTFNSSKNFLFCRYLKCFRGCLYLAIESEILVFKKDNYKCKCKTS